MRLFLDTNVLLDYLLNNRPDHDATCDFIELASSSGCELLFSTSQATDVFYSTRKHITRDQALDILRALYQICDLYPTSSTACLAALDSPMHDYEDAVQAEVARETRCDYIITRDYTDYAVSPVPYIDPAGFVALYGAHDGEREGNN